MDFLHDNIKKLFYKILFPAIGGALVYTAYSFVDAIAIGQGVGAEGTAACAVILPIFCIADFIGLLCSTGGSVLLGRAKGSGNQEKGNAYYTAAFLLVTLITLVAWDGTLLFQEPIYRMFGTSDVLLPYAMDYGKTITIAMPCFVLVGFLACFLRSDDVPNLIMVASLISAAVNIFGDWLFVFPMQMGIFGAALATALGSLV